MSKQRPPAPGPGNRVSRGISRVRQMMSDLPFIGAGPKGGKGQKTLQAETEKAANQGKLHR